MNITKAILLIHSQTPYGAGLPGITHDSKRIAAFHQSANGGGFHATEIYTLSNPTRAEVLRTIRSLHTDFLAVYVSAHGYTDQYGKRMICLTDEPIEDVERLNSSRWQYVAIDACRTVSGARIGGIVWPEEPYQNFTGETWARNYFDECLLQTAPGKMIVHATSHNLPAYEDRSRMGGQFTLAWLDVIRQYQDSGETGYLTIDHILPVIHEWLSKDQNAQYPQIVYRTPSFAIPLAIISPELIIPKEYSAEAMQKVNGWQVLAALSLITFVTYAVSK